ncbi:exodeoxyribonuclease V subunit alpha [Myxococcota bacterium]|nr:exodeoxyribonuclease V subunit alpha [Myxococcota bacterium]
MTKPPAPGKPRGRALDADTIAALKDELERLPAARGIVRVRTALAEQKLGDEHLRAAQELVGLKLALEGLDLAPALAELATELVAMEDGLDASDARALRIVAVAALVALEQGSTRLPLAAREGEAWSRDLLALLCGSRGTAEDLRLRFLQLVEDHRAPRLVGAPGDHRPIIVDRGYVHVERMLRQEERFAQTLARRILRATAAPSAELDAAIGDVLARPALHDDRAVTLSAEQERAVRRAVSAPFTVISGGPGTGKTSIVVAILRALLRLGHRPESIALAAPTGKAANRIRESVERSLAAIGDPGPEDRLLQELLPEARTLHRLLGYVPTTGRFLHHENNRLAERIVIVDETSMIDLVSMERLVRAVRDDARLVLLGDAEQLPSVDAGAVLRDIVSETEREGSRVREVALTLTQSFRMDPKNAGGRAILSIAQRIREGRSRELFAGPAVPAGVDVITVREHARDLTFTKVELFEVRTEEPTRREPAQANLFGGTPVPQARSTQSAAQALRQQFLDRWYLERVRSLEDFDALVDHTYTFTDGGFDAADTARLARLFAHFERARLLAVTRSAVLPTGAEALNEALHARALRDARIAGTDAPSTGPIAGEPLLVTKNDYERQLFNGDQGVALWVREPLGPRARMAVFPVDGGFVAHDLAALGDEVSLAYAMTVHKAQGSEADAIALVLPERDLPMSTREILYTALTRARASVTIVGDRGLFVRAVDRRIHRYSGVRERLAAALER